MSETPIQLKRPAALFEGGPWHGWSRYVDNTEDYAVTEGRMGFDFPYKKTKRHRVHARTGGKESEIWAYRPTERSRF